MSDYKLVPVEPTAEMMATGSIEMGARDEDARTVWKAMIAAAPTVQREPVGEAVMLQMVEGMTAAFFYASHVPAGTPLYTAPQPAEQERFKRFNGQECWMWAGDGSDRLETLTCPVVITPADLMAIINRGSPAESVAGMPEFDALIDHIYEEGVCSEGVIHLANRLVRAAIQSHIQHAMPVQPAEQQPCPESVREDAPYDDPAFSALCREYEIWGTPAAAQCAVFWEAGKRVAEQGEVQRLREALETIAAYPYSRDQEMGATAMRKVARDALAAYRKGGE